MRNISYHDAKDLYMRTLLLSSLALFFIACSSHHEPLPTVEKVDVNRYLGTWYEIARYEHSFEKGCSNVSATYSLRGSDEIDVLNRCQKEDGSLSEAKGIAYATDASNAKLKVSFFRPFYGNYWVIMLDEDYSYAVIAEPSREYFWILSRTKKLDDKVLKEILQKLPEYGYSADKLIWTPQN